METPPPPASAAAAGRDRGGLDFLVGEVGSLVEAAPAEILPPRNQGLLTVSKEWKRRVKGKAERLARWLVM